jgi:hypothetical protein
MENSTVDQRVKAQPEKMPRSRVNAITRLVHARSDHLRLLVLACGAYNARRREALSTTNSEVAFVLVVRTRQEACGWTNATAVPSETGKNDWR